MILAAPDRGAPLAKKLFVLARGQSAPAADAGEQRLTVSGIQWAHYDEIERSRGEDAGSPRVYFLDGEMEFMTTSLRHEKLAERLGSLLELWADARDVELDHHGRATMKRFEEAGGEPDKSWCVGGEKEWPDLVLEVLLTSGGVRKLALYRTFGVREVWFWKKGELEAWSLRPDGSDYDGPARSSALLPGLDFALLARCAEMPGSREARRVFREAI